MITLAPSRVPRLARLAAALGALLVGCGTSGSAASPGPASSPGSAGPDAAQADDAHIVTIYRHRCGACHRPVAPGSEPRDKLHAALVAHRKRTRLTEREWTGIEAFLSAAPPAALQ
jgi:cytochrome c5